MDTVLTILRYEYRMQLRRPAGWAILAAAAVMALLDSFPSPENLVRLEFLDQPAYFVYRIMSLDALVLLFGLTFRWRAAPPGHLRGDKGAIDGRPGGKGTVYPWKTAGGLAVHFHSPVRLFGGLRRCLPGGYPLSYLPGGLPPPTGQGSRCLRPPASPVRRGPAPWPSRASPARGCSTSCRRSSSAVTPPMWGRRRPCPSGSSPPGT